MTNEPLLARHPPESCRLDPFGVWPDTTGSTSTSSIKWMAALCSFHLRSSMDLFRSITSLTRFFKLHILILFLIRNCRQKCYQIVNLASKHFSAAVCTRLRLFAFVCHTRAMKSCGRL